MQREPCKGCSRLHSHSLVEALASVSTTLREVEGWWRRETQKAVFSDFLKLNWVSGSKNMNIKISIIKFLSKK